MILFQHKEEMVGMRSFKSNKIIRFYSNGNENKNKSNDFIPIEGGDGMRSFK